VGRAVLRARAAGALFGSAEAVRIGRYELLGEIGSGGGGTVYVARDPELHREVALKLVRAEDETLRARAFAEAQALARLSHPNVVPVFDVGMLDDRVWLVMELVRGESLRAFAARAPALREVLRAYRQAGEGLCAAHDAGLLHRDFKPDNAVIGGDGRVRVIDFGLAEPVAEDAAPKSGTTRQTGSGAADDSAGAPPEGDGSTASPTAPPEAEAGDVEGAAMAVTHRSRRARGVASPSSGTPLYMAPEQLAGADATAASDQFAFAVSLREAASRGASPLPRWLEAIVRRGTAEDPTTRYPSLRAMVRALDDDPTTRWRRRALVAAPVAFALIGFFAGRGGEAAPDACDGAAALAPVWAPQRATALRAQLGARGTPFATGEADRFPSAVDAWARRWVAAHQEGCAARARGAFSASLEDRHLGCMAGARARLDETLQVVARADDNGLPAAVAALSELPEPEACSDPNRLVEATPPPPAVQRAEVASLEADLQRVAVRVEAAVPEAASAAEAVVGRARSLSYRPLLARALLVLGRARMALDQRQAAIPALSEASALALGSGDDATAVEAFARAMWLKGVAGGEGKAALAGLDVVAPLAERLGPSQHFARALLHNNAGSVELAAGRPERARGQLETALALAKTVQGPGEVELVVVRTNMTLVARDEAERVGLLDEAVRLLDARVGPDHPLTLRARIVAAFGISDPPQALQALRAPCLRFAQLHPGHAATLSECSSELAWLELAYGDRASARALFATLATLSGPDVDPRHAPMARAWLSLLDGDASAALRSFQDLAAADPLAADAEWWRRMAKADLHMGTALAAAAAGHGGASRDARARAGSELQRARSVQPAPEVLRRLLWVEAAAAVTD
jgi:tetratricopeptide (TPR) repeat protein